MKMLYAGQINEDLGYLYERVLLPKMMTEDNAKALAKVMFTHRLEKNGKAGEKIVILHSQMQEEEVYPLGSKNILVQIYNRDHLIFFQDSMGNRFLMEDESAHSSCANEEIMAN